MHAGIDFRFRGVLIITEMLKRKKKHYRLIRVVCKI